MGIFQEFAPSYWDAGIPVMPLKRFDSHGKGAGKAPILSEWTQYGDVMPTASMREHWLVAYPDSNIGLPFGPASGLCAIDIDTEDDALIDVIRGALPVSPWVRVGKKGMGLIYKWQGQNNFKLRNNENQSIVEFLGKGNQMVMPPSIHPETHKPYVSDTNLWEVLDKIQLLPNDVEARLRAALEPVLGTKGFTLAQSGRSAPLDVVPQGERDIQLVRHAGYLSRVVRGIDKKTRFSLKEAMEQMRTWVTDFTASASGDDMDPDKGVSKMLEFLLKDVEKGDTLPNGWDEGLTDAELAHPTIAALIEKNKVQRWTLIKARDWLEAHVTMRPGDPDWASEKVQQLIALLAADENFPMFDFKQFTSELKRHIPAASKPDLVAAYKEAKQGDVEVAADHEAIARQVLDEIGIGGQLKYDMGRFWQWNGSCFAPLQTADVTKYIGENVKGNILARRQNDYTALTRTVEILARSPLAEQYEIGINFANGFLDAGLKMHDHSPKYGKTFTMPFNYIPERADEAHKWLQFLEQSWGDDEDYAEKVMALQEAMAATMFGLGTQYQRAFLLHGKPKTGKSQALEVIRAMMPADSRCSISPSLWKERFQLANMVGKTLNIAGELPEESVINGEMFKKIIAGEEVANEFKGKDSFDFKPIAAHWFGSNFLPKSRDGSGGFVRRWLILDFNRPVRDNERVVDFWKVLVSEEREAIAAWAIRGLGRLQAQGDYTQPSSHLRRLAQVLRNNNSVAGFLQWSDKVLPQKDTKADARAVFDHYVYYMKNISKGWAVTYERFIQMIGELGYEADLYHDATGVQRQELPGLVVKGPALPS
jgi:putative DNA primase/helicase